MPAGVIAALDQLRPEIGESHRSAMLLDPPGDAATTDTVASATTYFEQVDPRSDVRQGDARCRRSSHDVVRSISAANVAALPVTRNMRIAAIAIVDLCMAAPVSAEGVLYRTDTDGNGFSWDKQGKAQRTGYTPERITVKVISETKRMILWQEMPDAWSYGCRVDTAGAGDDQVLFTGDPLASCHLLEKGFIKAPGGAVIDIFDCGVGMEQAGVAEPIGRELGHRQ